MTRTILPPKYCVCCGTRKAGAWVRNEDDFGVVTGWLCSPCRSWIEYERKYPTHQDYLNHLKIPENNPMYGKPGAMRGKKGRLAPAWKGGLSLLVPLRVVIMQTTEYINWRKSVFNRDGFICKHCGKTKKKLNAHHIKSFSEIIEEYNITTVDEALLCKELWDIDNGITYCTDCHKYYKKRRGKM